MKKQFPCKLNKSRNWDKKLTWAWTRHRSYFEKEEEVVERLLFLNKKREKREEREWKNIHSIFLFTDLLCTLFDVDYFFFFWLLLNILGLKETKTYQAEVSVDFFFVHWIFDNEYIYKLKRRSHFRHSKTIEWCNLIMNLSNLSNSSNFAIIWHGKKFSKKMLSSSKKKKEWLGAHNFYSNPLLFSLQLMQSIKN